MTSSSSAIEPLPPIAAETIRFPVTGMVCGSCVSRITRALRGLPGVFAVRVDLGREAVTVRREPAVAPDAALAAAISQAGYQAQLESAEATDPSETDGLLGRFARRLR